MGECTGENTEHSKHVPIWASYYSLLQSNHCPHRLHKDPNAVATGAEMKAMHGTNSTGHLFPRSPPNVQPSKSRV